MKTLAITLIIFSLTWLADYLFTCSNTQLIDYRKDCANLPQVQTVEVFCRGVEEEIYLRAIEKRQPLHRGIRET